MRVASLIIVATLLAPLARAAAQAPAVPAPTVPAPAVPAPAVKSPSTDHAAHWTYEGAEGPSAWSRLDPAWKTCTAGHEQSPIDLGASVLPHTAPIDERFSPSPFVLFNNGHTVQAALERPSKLTAEGGQFDAVQFHFHHPSEHTVKGKVFPAELHLVHKNAKGELAVLGILIAIGSSENAAFETLIARLPGVAGDSVKFTTPVDLGVLLDDHAGKAEEIFTYHGSLTTPPCSEGVKWTVRSRPIQVSFGQMRRLVKVLGESARPVQPVYARH